MSFIKGSGPNGPRQWLSTSRNVMKIRIPARMAAILGKMACLMALFVAVPRSSAAGWVPPVTPRKFSVLELLGVPGTSVTIGVQVPSGGTTLWLKAHGLNYQNKASIRVNGGEWVALNNTNCVFDYPGDRLSGMGGPLDTLSFRVTGVSLVPRRANTISFRFNFTDGVSIGYRILDLNILNSSNRRLLPEAQPVFVRGRTSGISATDIAAGSNLWYNANLRLNWIGDSMNAKCADCHADNGADLKYFSYSDKAISERARFHGLTLTQGRQIAAYIRSLPLNNPGTPWDPPYQPGPGQDAKPVADFAAGAGLQWVLPDDSLSFDYLFPDGTPQVNFTNTVNVRDIPIAMPLPDWNSWLPRVHPKDSYGPDFQPVYDALRFVRDEPDITQQLVRFNEWQVNLWNWSVGPATQLPLELRDGSMTAMTAWWSVGRWRSVKSWDVIKTKGLEDRGQEMFDWPVHPKSWPTHSVFISAPHYTITHPDAHFLRNGSRQVWDILSHQWYWLQMILNDANHRHLEGFPIDWPYLQAFTSSQYAYGLGVEAQATIASIKVGESSTYNPQGRWDGVTAYSGVSMEWLWNTSWGNLAWKDYDPQFRDAVVRAILSEHKRMIQLAGREHFRDTMQEIFEGESDNSNGPPRSLPLIRSFAGNIQFLKDHGAAPDIVEMMKDIGQYLWPAADWSRF